jgi:hypothetical protein
MICDKYRGKNTGPQRVKQGSTHLKPVTTTPHNARTPQNPSGDVQWFLKFNYNIFLVVYFNKCQCDIKKNNRTPKTGYKAIPLVLQQPKNTRRSAIVFCSYIFSTWGLAMAEE